MAEIGETLREARMRRRIDMTEVEAATKIRAKYLRALENEEWDLLPGPTFVKTFLRTYAEYLELDPRLLVEEYRQRFERPSTQDLTPFGPGMSAQRRRRQRPRRSAGPFLVVLMGILILGGALYLLGVVWGDSPPDTPAPKASATATATAVATASPAKKSSKKKKKAAPTRASLRLTAGATRVYVCVVDATGKAVVNGDYLEPGKSTRTLRSQRFRMNFGNGDIRMRVGGKSYKAADLGKPIGYEVRPGKKPTRLSEAARIKLCAT
ncbi:MAG TPA: helix-turn-helix domain-containing protein [Solirubrobacter sp.]